MLFEHEFIRSLPTSAALQPFLYDLPHYIPMTRSEDSPLDDALVDFFYGRSKPSEELEQHIKTWGTIADEYVALLGDEEVQSHVMIPKHSRIYGKFEECEQYFGAALGATKLAGETLSGVPISDSVSAWYESGRLHAYTSFTGVQLTIPWDSSDTRVTHLSQTPGIQARNLPSTQELPAMLLDMDVDAINGDIIIYEISQHKFGWYWGIQRALRVPTYNDGPEYYGTGNAAALIQESPLLASLQQDVQRSFRKITGGRISDRLNFGLGAARQLGERVLGHQANTIWILSPDAVLPYRGEEQLASQINLTQNTNAMHSVAQSYGEAQIVHINEFPWISLTPRA